MIFYNVILFLYVLSVLPKLIYDWIFLKKKRSDVLQRLGFKKYHFETKDKFVIWIHAVSVGEAKASQILIKHLRQKYENAYIILSSVTETGSIEANNTNSDICIFMPFDFSWAVKKALNSAKPKLIFFIETDFWYNFLKYSKKLNSKNYLISGKISKTSYLRFLKLKFFSKKLFGLFDHIFSQNQEYLERFENLSTTKVSLSGNLKFFSEIPKLTSEEKENLIYKLKLSNKKVITIASTHYPEEKMILEQLAHIWPKMDDLVVLLAPRHPERFKSVYELLKKESIDFGCYSNLQNLKGSEKIILLDTMGFVIKAYQLSSLAIVAGSFTDQIGGHNILEPVYVDTPVFFGPCMFGQKDLKKQVLAHNCGKQLSINEIKSTLVDFYQDQSLQENMISNCNLLKQNNSQVLSEILEII